MSVEKVTIGDAVLYRADCRDVLSSLESVDVAITDPPYSEKTHSGARTVDDAGNFVELVKFDPISADDFLSICRIICSLSLRWVVMTCEYRYTHLMEQAGLPLIRVGAWVKPNPTPQFTGDRPGQGWEAVAVLHRGGRKRWNGGGRAGVWTVPTINKAAYPTQKPLPLFLAFVRDFSDPGETVLDPFMGSGTTGEAALSCGRKFIGIERNPIAFELSCKRMVAAQAQGKLFAPPPAQSAATQFNLL